MMSRRLPIYLLIDVSGSMKGTAINSVSQGLFTFRAALHADPRSLETAHISVITFGSVATQVCELVSCDQFEPPTLVAEGGTAMGEAMHLVEERIRAEVVRSTTDSQKGDWKPIVFIMTDGKPSDQANLNAAIESFQKRRYATIIGCAAGSEAKESVFEGWTDARIRLADVDEASISAYFIWVTQSVRAASASAGLIGAAGVIPLPPPPPNSGLVIVP
jgi:uncharacterized protein YegL